MQKNHKSFRTKLLAVCLPLLLAVTYMYLSYDPAEGVQLCKHSIFYLFFSQTQLEQATGQVLGF